ncbi:MAG TPA: PEP/pyruvate-binding domain-containing protein [Ktedonobacteraceae bacterium]|jgi:pyruvate,water dikinase
MPTEQILWPAGELVVPLESLDRTSLPLAGGKAASLGALIQAGFAVPPGFCVTTVAYAAVAARANLHAWLPAVESTAPAEHARLAELARSIRSAILHTPLPSDIIAAATAAYQALSAGDAHAVAVRSSATTEDLPDASFAGQQTTFLQVKGSTAVLSAIQQCFASLWAERATQYRSSLGLLRQEVRLAVVVQRMVQAEVAGVLFTANPLTGKRQEAVIAANPGLGEAVVSGATNPDQVVVQTRTGEIVERRPGEKQLVILAAEQGGTRSVQTHTSSDRLCLSDEQIRALARLGTQIAAQAGSPQDIEWAIAATGQIFVLQARPITTLFPLPATDTTPEAGRIYLAFGLQQGTSRPFTPLGLSALRLLASGFLTLVAQPPADPLTGPRFVTEAAGRPFLEITVALRSAFGRRFLLTALREAEAHAAAGLAALLHDPRFSLRAVPRRALAGAFARLLIRTRLPWDFLQALLAPQAASTRVQGVVERLRHTWPDDEDAAAVTHLARAEHLLLDCLRLAMRVSPVMLAGMQSFALARRLLGPSGTQSECQIVLGGTPHNPTTSMNLALWRLAGSLRAQAWSPGGNTAAQLAQDYHQGRLPTWIQQRVARFLQEYGHQCVCELDLGLPRWSEDPTPVFALLADYLDREENALRPDLQLQRAQQAAHSMLATLAQRAGRRCWLRGRLVRLCLQRAHTLAGFREMTRFVIGLVLSQARAHLRPVGEALVRAEKLNSAEDLCFLTIPEVHAALAGADLRTTIAARQVAFERELRRRRVPLLLLSDGSEPISQAGMSQKAALSATTLQGVPASAGRVTGRARVMYDPQNAHLLPGEILVAPSTDPGWTPLFLTAAGLVMETGGAMAHGAIVAREYGLPAVVAVPGATTRITSGMSITLDGATGSVTIEGDPPGGTMGTRPPHGEAGGQT